MVKKENHASQRFKLKEQRSETPHLLVNNNLTRLVTGTCSELHAKKEDRNPAPRQL